MNNILTLGLIISLLFGASCASTTDLGNVVRDGSSFEKAIVVKSVGEEYEYAGKVCSDCQILQQSLVFKKKKPYDVLDFKKPNGEEVSYYFDISSFYGKAF